jgi:hypothetical protein
MGILLECVLGSYMPRSTQVLAKLGSKDPARTIVWAGMAAGMVVGMA